MYISPRQLEYLVAIAETGGITAAAARVGGRRTDDSGGARVGGRGTPHPAG